ncbi:hypothetical protein V6N13_005376 [Hibiscus sabdariffa]
MPGGYLKLIELGLKDCVDGIDAQPALGLVVHKDGKDATLSFPLENFESHVAAKCFHNGRFVRKLREKAASLHNVSLEQGTVTSLLELLWGEEDKSFKLQFQVLRVRFKGNGIEGISSRESKEGPLSLD